MIAKEDWRQGRNNPNCRYPELDDTLFDVVDTPEKAYFLGWIASDGHLAGNGQLSLSLQERDESVLKNWKSWLGHHGKIKICKSRPMRSFTICSTQIVLAICKQLQIEPGKKSNYVNVPVLSESLQWAFARGFFEGDGSVGWRQDGIPRCSIATQSEKILTFFKQLGDSRKLKGNVYKGQIQWDGYDAIEFLFNVYRDDVLSKEFSLNRKYDKYLNIALWQPGLGGSGNHGRLAQCRWVKTIKEAIPPYKVRATDSGFDLTLIELEKQEGNLYWYTTGIKIQPQEGFWFMIVPRSSIYKTGYIMANSIGVIDRTYVGPIRVMLWKVNVNAPDLELPIRLVQAIPMPLFHPEFAEVESLSESERGSGGFGSTGK